MADSEANVKTKSSKKMKKRKQIIHEEAERLSKMQRVESKTVKNDTSSEEADSHCNDLKFGSPWKNLQLILCIQNKQLDLQRKIKLAFNFVQSRVEDSDGTDQNCETIKLPRLLCFLNDWIQSLLISSDKTNSTDGKKSKVEGVEAYMDLRCWKIFKFCLEDSLKFCVSLNMSRNLLRPVHLIAKNALSLLENSSIDKEELSISGENYKLYDTALECVSLVFSSHGGLSNENLELWVSTTCVLLELVHKMYTKRLDGSNMGIFAQRFLCFVLQPFSKFLRVHPARKNGFHDFVDKLLEPLLHLSGELHLQVSGSNPIWTGRLLKLVEEVLSHGLFHPVHLDGFLSLHVSEMYVTSCDDKSEETKVVIKSYHRHLFDVLNKIIARKNTMAMGSIGFLFHLFVNAARKLKGTSVLYEETKKMETTRDLRQLESGETSSDMSSDTRKSLINFFVQIMEPLLQELHEHLQAKMDDKLLLSDIHGILKSISNLLASYMQEKVYLRTEDVSGGACLNFLKKIYNVLMSCSGNLLSFFNYDVSNKKDMELFTLSANEILVAIGYLLEIEYEVIGEDLENLWLTGFSYLAISWTLTDVVDQCSLSSCIPGLGCQIIELYCQLRQVDYAILALCKAIRHIICQKGNPEESSRFLTSLSNEAYSESVERLLSSQEFVNAIHKAVQSIPEGKVSGCIRHLTDDISESLRWIKDSSSLVDGEKFNKRKVSNLQVELLGRGLSRVYVLVLDSITITEGNSNLTGVAIKDLVALLRPSLSVLVGQQPDAICSFLSYIMGKAVKRVAGKRKVLKKFGWSSQWVVIFYFQLLVSCRSLHRQAISLMPPVLSKKMSAEAGFFTAYSAHELMERIDGIDMGYFSWIVQPSASLLVVMQFISEIYLEDGSSNSYSLIYTFHSMALQRLVDLNRLIVLFNYLQNNHYDSQIESVKDEAAGLTNFMMESLSCIYQSPVILSDEVNPENVVAQDPCESNGWDLGVCASYKTSLLTAIWSNLCKNIDVWGNHASKKHLKKFFTHLLHTSLYCIMNSFQDLGAHEIDENKRFRGVTLPQISSELLSNSILYEQKFTCRNLASRICCALEKSVLPLFINIAFSDVNLQRSPNWLEFMSDLDNSAIVVDGNEDFSIDCSTIEMPMAQSCENLPADVSREEKAFPLTSKNFAICHHLLNLLCWIPDISARSFSLYVTCIFNLERLIVRALLHFLETVNHDCYYEFLRLFVSCRKALRYVIVGFCEKTIDKESLPNSIISESSFPVLWLFKSVSVILGHTVAFSAKNTTLHKHMVFSLMDYTSYVLLEIGKYQIIRELPFNEEAEKPSKEMSSDRIVHEESHLLQSSQYVDFSKFEPLKTLTYMTENLKEQMQNLLVYLKDGCCCGNLRFSISFENMNRLSFIVSGLSGFLWSLASVMEPTYVKGCDNKGEVLMWNNKHTSKLNTCIHALLEVFDFFVQKLFVGNNQPSKHLPGAKCFTLECSCTKADVSLRTQQESEAAITCTASPANGDDFKRANNMEKLSEPQCDLSVASILASTDSFEPERLNMHLLQSLLKGDHPEVAFLLRQLLIASSFLLKLNLQKDSSSLLSSFVPTLVETSQVLLLEFTKMAELPQQSAFLLLDGVLSYLRELSSYFIFTDSASTRKLYTNLIELYLRALGKTISLQGRRATLTFHERQSSTKNFHERSFESHSSSELYCFSLDEFKARLRMSFKAYIEKPLELHLSSSIQAIERALVGVRGGRAMIHDIKASANGGKISSIVAAGIDCFDMILEFVSGHKGLKLIKRHFRSLVAAVLNIILHLQSPRIFYGDVTSSTVANDPDPGSTILMCVEVLITVSRKHTIFQMDSWHVGHLLRIPAALFQSFSQLGVSKGSGSSNSSMISEEQIPHPVEAVNLCYVDQQFSLSLFVACCQLLCTTIKHHQSECKRCVAHLEASVAVLLNCLETVDNKDFFSWEVEEGVKCACFLRRVYEEIKQQKDIFTQQCSLFLSNYIWVYSGYGPKKSGIRREIDDALRPGVYALIDACSADDLQYLHTVFGEGPCRNTLASLQHDYKLNFKYEGKV